jgi:hypothetical protein
VQAPHLTSVQVAELLREADGRPVRRPVHAARADRPAPHGMDRRSVHRYVARAARVAGTSRPIGPHALRTCHRCRVAHPQGHPRYPRSPRAGPRCGDRLALSRHGQHGRHQPAHGPAEAGEPEFLEHDQSWRCNLGKPPRPGPGPQRQVPGQSDVQDTSRCRDRTGCSRTEPADRWLTSEGGVAAGSVVVLQPAVQGERAFVVAGPGGGVGPFGLQGAVESLGLAEAPMAVKSSRVWPRLVW